MHLRRIFLKVLCTRPFFRHCGTLSHSFAVGLLCFSGSSRIAALDSSRKPERFYRNSGVHIYYFIFYKTITNADGIFSFTNNNAINGSKCISVSRDRLPTADMTLKVRFGRGLGSIGRRRR